MNVFDKIRIKIKIKKLCKKIQWLLFAEQKEYVEKIVCCLRTTECWKEKEKNLDDILERLNAVWP